MWTVNTSTVIEFDADDADHAAPRPQDFVVVVSIVTDRAPAVTGHHEGDIAVSDVPRSRTPWQ